MAKKLGTEASTKSTMTWKSLLNGARRRNPSVGTDHRDAFEQDLGRAIFSNPVKRLQDKAQVFPLDPCDAVRTRLTHSLEVSSVAKGLGLLAGKWLSEQGEIDINNRDDRAIEAIVTTCGLIHDLGNPPFGHSGEDAIAHWFKSRFEGESVGLLAKLDGDDQQAQDFLKFEGNAQSLRLVGRLQILSDSYGLNLTYGTLSALMKYVAKSNEAGTRPGNHAYSKPGHFWSENEMIAEIRRETGTAESRNPLTFLVEAADDIVYSVADVEDGIKKGILTWETLLGRVKGDAGDVANRVLERVQKILHCGESDLRRKFSDDVYASAFRTAAIAILTPSVFEVFKSKYGDIMSGAYPGELVKDCDAARLVKTLKNLGKEEVYCTPETLKLELKGRKVIGDLMDVFWEGAETMPVKGKPSPRSFQGKAAALFSDNYRTVFQESVEQGMPLLYCRFQLLTDQICGMTDSYAIRLHSELTNGG